MCKNKIKNNINIDSANKLVLHGYYRRASDCPFLIEKRGGEGARGRRGERATW